MTTNKIVGRVSQRLWKHKNNVEKSVLKYQSYFGIENNIAVACCGSNLSVH